MTLISVIERLLGGFLGEDERFVGFGDGFVRCVGECGPAAVVTGGGCRDIVWWDGTCGRLV